MQRQDAQIRRSAGPQVHAETPTRTIILGHHHEPSRISPLLHWQLLSLISHNRQSWTLILFYFFAKKRLISTWSRKLQNTSQKKIKKSTKNALAFFFFFF
jgi:hypothetical protein